VIILWIDADLNSGMNPVVVAEHGSVSDHNMTSDYIAVAYLDIILDKHIRTDHHRLSDSGFFTNQGVVHIIYKLNNGIEIKSLYPQG